MEQSSEDLSVHESSADPERNIDINEIFAKEA